MAFSIRKSLGVLGGGFLLLFLFRIFYGYTTHPAEGAQYDQVIGNAPQTFSYAGKNYASKSGKNVGANSGSGTRVPLSVDQKYEKVGTISTKSKDYDGDESRIRAAIDEAEGLIQFEQSSGLEGQRGLHLAVGVIPENFDSLIKELSSYGTLLSIRIDKIDKTNEYRMLQAKRASLEATKESLLAVKEIGGGSIEELIALEEKIAETESAIQDLGVNLGDYDAENEFCTVKCSLLEVSTRRDSGIGLLQRIKVALEWTVAIYLRMVLIGFVGTLTMWALMLAVLRIRKYLPGILRFIDAGGKES